MNLSQDPDTRARLRMLRMWVTPEQFREICAGLEQVEAPPRKTLRHRIDLVLGEARTFALVCLRMMAGAVRRARVAEEAARLQR